MRDKKWILSYFPAAWSAHICQGLAMSILGPSQPYLAVSGRHQAGKIFYTNPKNISGEGWRGAAGHQPDLDAAGGRQLRGHGPHRLRVQEVRHVSDG